MFFICCFAIYRGYVQAEKSLTFTIRVAHLCFEGLIEQEKTEVFATFEPKTTQIIPLSFSQHLQKVVWLHVCMLPGYVLCIPTS